MNIEIRSEALKEQAELLVQELAGLPDGAFDVANYDGVSALTLMLAMNFLMHQRDGGDRATPGHAVAAARVTQILRRAGVDWPEPEHWPQQEVAS